MGKLKVDEPGYIGNRKVIIEYSSSKPVDWEAIAYVIAQAYMKDRVKNRMSSVNTEEEQNNDPT